VGEGEAQSTGSGAGGPLRWPTGCRKGSRELSCTVKRRALGLPNIDAVTQGGAAASCGTPSLIKESG